VVGDPETVVDEHGRLPRDRRETFRCEFAAKVNAEVSGLHEKLPALRASLKATRDRRERAAAPRGTVPGHRPPGLPAGTPHVHRRRHVLRVPRPMAWHSTGATFCLETGAALSEPCPSWPVWNAKITTGLVRVAEMMRHKHQLPALDSVAQPLAALAAGCSAEDTIAPLTQAQAGQPRAPVRRGKAGLLTGPDRTSHPAKTGPALAHGQPGSCGRSLHRCRPRAPHRRRRDAQRTAAVLGAPRSPGSHGDRALHRR
jgi:hypothetical protein